MASRRIVICLLLVGLFASTWATTSSTRSNSTVLPVDNEVLLQQFMKAAEERRGLRGLDAIRQAENGQLFGSMENCLAALPKRQVRSFANIVTSSQSGPIVGAERFCECMMNVRDTVFPDRYPTPGELETALPTCFNDALSDTPSFDVQYVCHGLQELTSRRGLEAYQPIFRSSSFYLYGDVAEGLLPLAPLTLGSTICKNAACPITATQIQRAIDEREYSVSIQEVRFQSSCLSQCARDFADSLGSTYCDSRLTYSGLYAFYDRPGFELPTFSRRRTFVVDGTTEINMAYPLTENLTWGYNSNVELAEELCSSLFPPSRKNRCCRYEKSVVLGLCCKKPLQFDCSYPDYRGERIFIPCFQTTGNSFWCSEFQRAYVAVNGRQSRNLIPSPPTQPLGRSPPFRLAKLPKAFEVAKTICSRYGLPYSTCCSIFIQPLYDAGWLLELPIVCQNPCSLCGPDQNCVFSDDRAFCVECNHFSRKFRGELEDCCSAGNDNNCVPNELDDGTPIRCRTRSKTFYFEENGDQAESTRADLRPRSVCRNMDFFLANEGGCEIVQNEETGDLECVTPSR